MQEFFEYTPLTIGSKGLVFIGENLLVYRRSHDAPTHPDEIDLPGGAPEGRETPFETFTREVQEEFGLKLDVSHISAVRRYPSTATPGKYAYFPIAKVPAEQEAAIRFGDEGSEYMLMSTDEFLTRRDVWPVLQERARDVLGSGSDPRAS